MSSGKDSCDNECITKEGGMKTQNVGQSTIDNISNLVGGISLDHTTSATNESQKLEIRNTVSVPSWLQECETPFLWHTQQKQSLGPDSVILRILEKLDDLLIEEPEFSLQRFVSLLNLVLEYYIVGDTRKCQENMKTIEGCLEEEISRNEPSYQKCKLSLGHVVSATKAHVLYILGNEEESKKIGKDIIPVKIMTDSDKAVIESMKARYFLNSGYENAEALSVEFARKALDLEPDNAEYEFVLAKVLRQQRRDELFSTEVPRDELKLLESAVKKDKQPKYLVYLAQVYRECATQAVKQYRNHPNFYNELKPAIDLMSEKSLEYYKEALAVNSESPAGLRRIGYGIMNLNKKYADYPLALKCLLKSDEITESTITLHMLGTFYLRYGNDKQKALEYFERTAKTGSVAGQSDMIRVKWMLDPKNYDPRQDLEHALTWMLKKKDHTIFMIQLGGYYLFIKRDFCKAIEYFKPIILEDKNSTYLLNFKSYFLKMNEPINLTEYLANEAMVLAQEKTSTSDAEPGIDEVEGVSAQPVDQEVVNDFLNLIRKSYPELMEMTPDETLIQKLIDEDKKIQASWSHYGVGRDNPRGRGREYGAGRDNSRGRGRGGRRGFRGGRFGGHEGENRGRYSVTNPRDQGEVSGGERRGGFHRGQGSRNWHSRPRNTEGQGDDKEVQENWRKR